MNTHKPNGAAIATYLLAMVVLTIGASIALHLGDSFMFVASLAGASVSVIGAVVNL